MILLTVHFQEDIHEHGHHGNIAKSDERGEQRGIAEEFGYIHSRSSYLLDANIGKNYKIRCIKNAVVVSKTKMGTNFSFSTHSCVTNNKGDVTIKKGPRRLCPSADHQRRREECRRSRNEYYLITTLRPLLI